MRENVLEAFQEEAGELLRRAERVLHGAIGRALTSDEALVLRRTFHTLKGSAAAVGEGEIEHRCHALEDQLRLLEEANGSESDAVDALFTAVEALRGELVPMEPEVEAPASPENPTAEPAAPPEDSGEAHFDPDALIRIRPRRIDALHNMVGELVVTRLQYQSATDRMVEARERSIEGLEACKRAASHVASLRRTLPDGAYRSAHETVQQAVAAFQETLRLTSLASRSAVTAQAQAAAVTTDLDDAVRELRLMPLHPFFEDYAHVVREAARDCGKRAKVQIRAHGVEVDRSVLLRLRDPMLHLVRNAVVHGLESPDARAKLGKDEVGTVLLEARAEGTRAVIRVVDDGGGIDEPRVRRKAAAMGLVDGQRPLSDRELLETMAHPGLSTHEHADHLAGRGIGLDVVADTLRELNGQLHLDNVRGAGCVFTLEVPITASMGSGLVVECAGQHLILLLVHVERIVRIDASDLVDLDGRDTVRVDGELAAVVRLADLIGLGGREAPRTDRRPGVVLRSGGQRLVLEVDDVVGEQALVIKPLGEAFRGADFLLGGAVQADHAILPVLQVPVLFRRAAGAPARSRRSEPAAAQRPRSEVQILVVDDSITMRTLERNILQAAGYSVRAAQDGVAAYEDYERNGPPHLVITDLQMPRMDGVGLCKAIRSSSHPNTPVMIVTSVGEQAEKTEALEAGADAYIVKSDFEQDRFLDLVRHLTGAVDSAA